MITLNDLLEQLRATGKSYDLDFIARAHHMAEEAHRGQLRDSGEPYITHPLSVASILVDLGMDTDTVAAALLHDVVEDTPITSDEVRRAFSEDVAMLVEGVTKLGKIPFSTREEQQAENLRKMLLAMSEDIRVMIIKLADRLHNMRTLSYRHPDKQRQTALETMEVFAPIAHRLGIRGVKEELEDISIRYLDPIGCKEIDDALVQRADERDAFLENIREKISDRLSADGRAPHIAGRVKSTYGIYRKMYMQGKDIAEIYDIFAVRIIVDTVIECYNILGIIHDMFRPIPNRFKDYISTPKPNMYQSLHTTVIDKEGIPFEVQIRTWDMHHTAEYGVAAHWKYKAGIQGRDKLETKLAWVRQLLEVQKDSEDAEEIVRLIKSDIAPEEVFVFTPKGDVFSLPIGATVIDFAYAIHTAVGNRMTGAKVDGRIVPINYKVKTGQIVEILTSSAAGRGPSRDWLNIVVTGEARTKIRNWFKKERREENIVQGKAELDREFRRNGIHLPEEKLAEFLEETAHRQKMSSVEDFYAAIGYGGIILSKIMPRIRDDYQKKLKSEDISPVDLSHLMQDDKIKHKSGVIVEGIDNCLVRFAHCCNPLPGDEIVGFITRGYGVSIHKADCPNASPANRNLAERERWVGAHWASRVTDSFKSTITILALDRTGLVADVSLQLAGLRVPIHSFNARETKNGQAEVVVNLSVNDISQLRSIMERLSKIKGVLSVDRS
ncbi:MAG: bifunctional (p)ppGpp synthetase/guanosine-3',5'-bis(diphosphate) 3'-pyrophosphohydrolase [Oscillospiraceae bacterium]|nr:bifunctional (p)ppGpp synthetase/guanosine-3',5'-bis(diphosphate) 3'-pyrophosphohydrolase [Oscillospiraceae bacterium]